ncbi:MAG: hypothetical protein K2L17_03540 [Muribaculaceae bacterium]|nr:hypothetical protein [Muribaculaceae bacterium]
MKNLYKNLLSGLCLILVSIPCFAKSEQIAIGLFIDSTLEDERPSKGNRAPAVSVICTIDFENHRIELSSSEFITAYELWDEDGTYVIRSNALDSEFADFISGLSGVYQLRLIGVEHAYIGYIDL